MVVVGASMTPPRSSVHPSPILREMTTIAAPVASARPTDLLSLALLSLEISARRRRRHALSDGGILFGCTVENGHKFAVKKSSSTMK